MEDTLSLSLMSWDEDETIKRLGIIRKDVRILKDHDPYKAHKPDEISSYVL